MKKINECCTVGIITYGRLAYTKQCIDAIWNTAGDYPFKIVVVNNFHPTENAENEEWLKEQFSVGRIHDLCLMGKNVGVAKAANTAWQRYPQNKYYLKLDNDMVARKKGWLDDLVMVFESNIKGLGSLGYSVEPTSYPVNIEHNSIKLRRKAGNIGGACLFIPKTTENLIGNFCEAYDIYGEEDCDYNVRLALSNHFNAYMEDEDAFFHLPAGKAAIIDVANGYAAADGIEEINETEYRSFKDSFREVNVPKLMTRIRGYQDKSIPIKQVSNANRDFRWKWCKL